MHKLLTYFLLILFTFQTCEVALIVANFAINQNFYAEICENRSKPEMECNGKCQLKKQLKQQEEKQSEKEKIIIEKESQNFIASCINLLPTPKISTLQKDIVIPDFQNTKDHISDIFHPPRL